MPKPDQTQLDYRSPLVLDTRDLPRRPGLSRAVERVVQAPEGLGVELIGVDQGTPVELNLLIEMLSEGVLVRGTARTEMTGECGRCLGEITDQIEVPIEELFVFPDSLVDQTSEEDEVARLHGDLIDLEPLIRDSVVLALPTNPVCRPDCPGLCPECGGAYDDLPADHHHDQVDSRWAALKRLAQPNDQTNPAR